MSITMSGSSSEPSAKAGQSEINQEKIVISKSLFYNCATSEHKQQIHSSLMPIEFSSEQEAGSNNDCVNVSGIECHGGGGGGDDAGDDNVGDVQEKRCKVREGRVRKRRFEEWEINVAKRKKNLGEAYVSYRTKKLVEARKIGASCTCPKKCFDAVGRENIEKIFSNFWKIGNYDLANSYMQSLIREVQVKRKRSKAEVSRRPVNYDFYVKVNNKDFKVCRFAFVSMHGVGLGKVKHLIRMKKQSPTGTPVPDRRGKHPSGKAIPAPAVERVNEYIRGLPVKSSPYNRSGTPGRQYLQQGGTIQLLYLQYMKWMEDNHNAEYIVSPRFFRTVFTTKYNIVFDKPAKDTCTTCVELQVNKNSLQLEGQDTTICNMHQNHNTECSSSKIKNNMHCNSKNNESIITKSSSKSEHGFLDF